MSEKFPYAEPLTYLIDEIDIPEAVFTAVSNLKPLLRKFEYIDYELSTDEEGWHFEIELITNEQVNVSLAGFDGFGFTFFNPKETVAPEKPAIPKEQTYLRLVITRDETAVTVQILDVTTTVQLPLRLGQAQLEGALSFSFNPETWEMDIDIGGEVSVSGGKEINLGSQLARLTFENEVKTTLRKNDNNKFVIAVENEGKGWLYLDLFSSQDGALIGSSWTQTDADSDSNDYLAKLPFSLDGRTPLIEYEIGANFPRIPKDTLRAIFGGVNVNESEVNKLRRLDSLYAPLLGGVENGRIETTFGDISKFTFGIEDEPFIEIQILMEVGEICNGYVGLKMLFGQTKSPDDKYFNLSPSSFELSGTGELTVAEKKEPFMGDLLALVVPKDSKFIFTLNGVDCDFRWQPSETNPNSKIELHVPAKPPNFVFELDEFAIHPGGIDLMGAVSNKGPVALAGSSLAGPVTVKSVERDDKNEGRGEERPLKIGECKFVNSCLVAASLQATAKLPYFDDAEGTLTLSMAQDDETNALSFAGTLDLGPLEKIHIAKFYTTWHIRSLSFSIEYTAGNWAADAKMSGSVEFIPPKDKSAAEAGIVKSLFDGVTVDLEDLTLIPLELRELTISPVSPPDPFTIADIFLVDLDGLKIQFDDKWKVKQMTLLGQITIQELPGTNSELRFGNIELSPGPRVAVGKIGGKIEWPGAFTIDVDFERINYEDIKLDMREEGFAGSMVLTLNNLGTEFAGLVKLTTLTHKGETYPAMAVYLDTNQYQFHIAYGFFLRRVGVGLGIRQVLRGLELNADQPLLERITTIIEDPDGLPEPWLIKNWRPVPQPPMYWMVVGTGLITFGKYAEDKTHLVAGSNTLTLDRNLDIFYLANLWLFASPQETRSEAFIRHPVARGAVVISPQKRQVVAKLQTLKKPKLGKKAPKLLREFLNVFQTNFFFLADQHGFVQGIGWPWNLTIDYSLFNIFKGKLRAGFLFGIYRSSLVMAQNTSITLVATRSYKVGLARFSFHGEGEFKTQFVGLLENFSKPYLYGAVNLSISIKVKYSIAEKNWLGSIIPFASGGAEVVLTGNLTAAMTPKPDLGFRGHISLAISICGRRFGWKVYFGFHENVVNEVEKKLVTWSPKIPGVKLVSQNSPSLTSPRPLASEEPKWHYRFRRMQRADGIKVIRVLLFPDANTPYPAPPPSDSQTRFQLTINSNSNAKFLGFVGSDLNTQENGKIEWHEAWNAPLSKDDGAPTVRQFLIDVSQNENTTFDGDEEVDYRALEGATGSIGGPDYDIAPEGLNSPDFAPNSAYDRLIRKASQTEAGSQYENIPLDEDIPSDDGIPSAFLFSELLALMREPGVAGGHKVPDHLAQHRIAPHLRLLLEFDASGFEDGIDPVGQLIDNLNITVPTADHSSATVKLGTVHLRGEGSEKALRQYDLVPGASYQPDRQICLTWEFGGEEESDLGGEISAAVLEWRYREVDEIVVTRTQLGATTGPDRVVHQRPSWVEVQNDDGSVTFMRPRFQFIDDAVQGIGEGARLEYEVVFHATDRVLARTIIPVTRRTVKRLTPMGQPLALNAVQVKKVKNGFEIGDSVIELIIPYSDEQPFEPAELVLRYRLVPSTLVGSYGFDRQPAPSSRWISPFPEGDEHQNYPDIKLLDSPDNTPVPWNETKDFGQHLQTTGNGFVDGGADATLPDRNWLHYDDGNKTITVGYHIRIVWGVQGELKEIQEAMRAGGMSLELYLGRERRDENGQPLERSSLVKCRHAVAAAGTAAVSWVHSDGTLDTGRGNEVDALEWIIPLKREIECIPASYLHPVVRYPDLKSESDPATPIFDLTWRHDVSGRGEHHGRIEKSGDFNPVIGYRIHCIDLYNPHQYPLPSTGMHPNPVRTVRAVPEALIRASLDTVQPRQMNNGYTDWQPQTETDASNTISAFNSVDRGGKANWQLIVDSHIVNTKHNAKIYWEGGPIWLHSDLLEFIKKVLKALGDHYICEISLRKPLEDRIALALFNNIEGDKAQEAKEKAQQNAKDEWKTLQDNLSQDNLSADDDPYGWLSAEALGLSCECRFLDANDQPVHAEVIREKLPNDLNVGVISFIADDGHSFLNVVRIIHLGRWEADNVLIPLVAQIAGREITREEVKGLLKNPGEKLEIDGLKIVVRPQERQLATLVDALIKKLEIGDLGDPENGWVTDIERRLGRSGLRTGKKWITFTRSHQASGLQTQSTLVLPIRQGGWLHYQLPVLDQWGHEYRVAIETVRRFDAMWQLLQDAHDDKRPFSNTLLSTSKRDILIKRTKSISRPNVIATPLPGSIQALVFRHPAAYAAAASAVNAARSQFAGQHITLNRRVKQDEKEKLINACNKFQFNQEAWQKYKDNHNKALQDLPQPPKFLDQSQPLQPVPDTETGIYGADRYVFPDLPTYYQYRVVAYSQAGQIASKPKETAWVTPFHTKERQRPKALACTSARWFGGHLYLDVPLVHLRHHLPPELHRLWHNAEESITINGVNLPLGILPDFYVIYHIFMRTSPPDADKPFLLLLGKLQGLFADPGADSGGLFEWIPANSAVNLTDSVKYSLVETKPAAPGGLYFDLKFELDDKQPAAVPLLEAIRAHGEENITELIHMMIRRNGVYSAFAPEPVSGNANPGGASS